MPESWTASGRRSASCRASSPRACRARRRGGFSAREEWTGRRCSTTPSCLSLKTARSASRRFRCLCRSRSRWARRRRTVRRCTSSRPIMFSSPISARQAPTSRGACFRCHVLRRARKWSPPFRTATRRRRCLSSTAAMTLRQESRCTTAGGLSFRRCTWTATTTRVRGSASATFQRTRQPSARRFCRAATSTSCSSAASARRGGSTARSTARRKPTP